MKPIVLITKRLKLRRAIDADSENLFRNYTAYSECSHFLTRKPHSHINQTSAFLKKWCDMPWDNESRQFAWVVSLADNDEAIGVFIATIDGIKLKSILGSAADFGSKVLQQKWAML